MNKRKFPDLQEMEPIPQDRYAEEADYEPEVHDVALVVIFGELKLKRLLVIAETWDHKNFGRGKREYYKTFTEPERRIIARWHPNIYNWYLRTGIPHKGVRMKLGVYALLCRAANFFATI
jgi:hypothetical protein